MFRKLTFAGVALAVAATVATAVPAQASRPIDPPSVQSFSVVCPTGQDALVTLPVSGAFAPGFIGDTYALLVPYRFDYRWTDGQGMVLLRSQAQAMTGPVPRKAITCELPPIKYADGTFFSFTVTAVVGGKP